MWINSKYKWIRLATIIIPVCNEKNEAQMNKLTCVYPVTEWLSLDLKTAVWLQNIQS